MFYGDDGLLPPRTTGTGRDGKFASLLFDFPKQFGPPQRQQRDTPWRQKALLPNRTAMYGTRLLASPGGERQRERLSGHRTRSNAESLLIPSAEEVRGHRKPCEGLAKGSQLKQLVPNLAY
ncbi:hypothetical protein AXG93_2145s1640 [Marchantia polymorpha subsp. ruderalis]|uniref:Uncharacterized protein n=1 Tax=Marchantia polymorpha subsp. ruderalis TaxID=1480154 RepID=A0A176W092_MARPO|nr:hypothetical protein AXG93_2145s1640 [Marchantia polymorpha subsp. ruderalis]